MVASNPDWALHWRPRTLGVKKRERSDGETDDFGRRLVRKTLNICFYSRLGDQQIFVFLPSLCKEATICWIYLPFSCLHIMSHETFWQVILRDLRSIHFSYDSFLLQHMVSKQNKLLSVWRLFFFLYTPQLMKSKCALVCFFSISTEKKRRIINTGTHSLSRQLKIFNWLVALRAGVVSYHWADMQPDPINVLYFNE